MFSGFRSLVEDLAGPEPRLARQDTSTAERLDHAITRAGSLESTGVHASQSLSSSQLAESALSNLRKSLATQRSASPSGSKSPERAVTLPKSNLEERLRAKFAIGEASNVTTPNASARVSPAPPTMVIDRPLSPRSTPLPDSPALSPTAEVDISAVIVTAISPELPVPKIPPTAPAPPATQLEANPLPEQTGPEESGEPVESEQDDSLISSAPSEHTPMGLIVLEPPPFGGPPNDASFAILQQRLKLVEQRFSDVSASFKKLQAEKVAADTLIRELTPLEGMNDADGLRDYLQNQSIKAETSKDEIKRLNGKLTRQDERMEELRDTHRLESKSQSDQIERLRRQVAEGEALISASESSALHAGEEVARVKAEIDRLQAEAERSNVIAKEEEEKRVKAISLLKSVRQKLVKAEKEKEEAIREASLLKERAKGERERERDDITRLEGEIDAVNAEREKMLVGLRAQFDRDSANLKDRCQKEILAQQEQYEDERFNVKSAHAKEISAKDSQILTLENSVKALSNDKNSIFDQLQLRQAEIESSQFHLESLQSQNIELQYQLREVNDRLGFLTEELAETRRERDSTFRGPTTSAEDLARLVSTAETKYEVRIADLKRNLTAVEKERNESEAAWSRKLREKARETDELKRVVESSTKARNQNDEVLDDLKDEIQSLQLEARSYRKQVSDLQAQVERVTNTENAEKLLSLEFNAKIVALERQAEESKAREAQTRANNKTLREELRKVQSSAALLERQRNPGVGYWTSRPDGNASSEVRTSISSSSSSPSRTGSPALDVPSMTTDEEVNLEYLRNVILQFLEHKEMRPNLVRVLSIILRFTPQETRRLIAKV